MKQVKAKYYPETQNIIPIETKLPILGEAHARHDYSGTDEDGDWVLVDFITGESAFYDYDIEETCDEKGKVVSQQVKTKTIGEDEWNKI